MNASNITIEELDDPEAIAGFHRCAAQAKRNDEWLQAHWPELLPRAAGKFLAVAGQEAFVAETHGEAWLLAKAAHPGYECAFIQYVIPDSGPRIYGKQRRMVAG